MVKFRAARPARPFLRLAGIAGLVPMLAGTAQPQSAAGTRFDEMRGRLLRAEDARGGGPEGIAPLLAGLGAPALRPLAIRAIGRLERPDLVGRLIPFLGDRALRDVTAEAIAQSIRGLSKASSRTASERALVDSIFRLLAQHARAESEASVRGAVGRSIARLVFDDPRQAREAEEVLVSLVAPEADVAEAAPAMIGIAHGLYTIARSRRTLGDLSPASVTWLRKAATVGHGGPAGAPVRRLAWLALAAGGVVDPATVRGAAADSDAQVRRLVVAALPNVQDSALRRQVLMRAATDSEPMVRLEWVRVFRQLLASGGCAQLLDATRDRDAAVRLAAIDALGGPCPERDTVVAVLSRLIESGPPGVTRHLAGEVSWHSRAHALAALARVDARAAQPLLQRDSRHPVWQVRMYVARGAAAMRDSALLTALAFDTVGNVREVALQGLSATVGHVADLVYLRALASPDYHVVLAAARALKGAPVVDSTLPGILAALERLSRERRQTSRDPRIELLARVDEMADQRVVPRLVPLLNDVDLAFSTAALRIVSRLEPMRDYGAGGFPVPVEHAPLPTGPVRVRVRMSDATGGGSFDVLLDPDRAPMTVARILWLIEQRYYDGLTWHRVVPNFVVQGGSPGMNEYVGDGPFMRDELSLAHHARGTLGVSTRGRDTGDAQWFINLVDNYRLDHDYTVFGRVVEGMRVVDMLLEGDVMESVRVIPNR